ncbi:hypothetical protein FEE95_00120 [Maribacter algarum]|uniref:Lipocalin-like domain-containing protein n=1 Tax=Maribacter algarum (ex Zhang et al. 2020) TaxID=2578118 RepID=A0A5S3QJ76_9FLAO|nr:hypothetical protein [Maribacter algarum]TMM57874.1 hypothetical protein FEE95_00120 [Maribacter algarum]
MKKNILIYGLGMVTLFFSACTIDADDGNNFANLQADIETITNNVSTGSWVITNFIDSGKNETGDFTGYGFSFNADGSLVADNATNNATGTWSITIDDDSNDDSNDDSSSSSLNDDNSDDDCNNCSVSQLTDVLTACSGWYVDKLELNDNDLEDNLNGYTFDFSADGTMNVSWNNNEYSGTWEASGSGNNIQVEITITDIGDLEATWTLHEIELENGESKVDLRIGGDDRLRFKNDCTIGNFSGGSSFGDIDFNIFFASPADFAELSEDWDIISHSASKIELKHVSGGDGGIDLLTFEKN